MNDTKQAIVAIVNGGSVPTGLGNNANVVVCGTSAPSPIRFVRRPATLLEKLAEQNMMYAPCRCGSGKKYRFCCHEKDGRPHYEIQL